MTEEIRLPGGRTTAGVVQVGDTVRRPLSTQAAFVHALLSYLERRGFSGAPRFLGLDGEGRESLSFVPGVVPSELGAFSDVQVDAAARLLRGLHDATVDCPLRGGSEVVCHGDASPCNCVFADWMPVAFIDFDNAHPGSRVDDVGYAAWLWLDVGNDDLSAELQGTRVDAFFRSYGMDSGCAIDAIVDAQRALSERTTMSGVREWADACRAWVERNRDALLAGVARLC
jgi:aminoglycoside phosphotransferase